MVLLFEILRMAENLDDKVYDSFVTPYRFKTWTFTYFFMYQTKTSMWDFIDLIKKKL